jgi:hypothetical protein
MFQKERHMSDVQQIAQDLQFVRSAVVRRERSDDGPPLILYLWAAYVIIGYTLMDFRPQYAGPFFAIGGLVGGIASWLIGRSYSKRIGEWDHATAMRGLLHFGGGIALACVFTVGLATFMEPLRGTWGSQVFVVMIGLVYFLWGVHYQRYFMFLGIVVMAGGVMVGSVPHFGWTILGAVISLGLILPTLIPRRRTTPFNPPTSPEQREAA